MLSNPRKRNLRYIFDSIGTPSINRTSQGRKKPLENSIFWRRVRSKRKDKNM